MSGRGGGDQRLIARVLYVCEFPTLNGGEHSLLAVLPQLRQRGIEPLVAGPGRGPLADALRQLDVPLLSCQFRDAGQKLPREQCLAQLNHAIAAADPQIVHANSVAMGRLVGSGVAAAGAARQAVAHLRDILRLSQRAIADLNLHHRVLAVSQATCDFHVAQGLDPARTRVVYNGVDTARFRPRDPCGALHRELGIPREHQLVGGVGQLGLRKGWDQFLQVAAEILASRKNVHFVCVGERNSQKRESIDFERALYQAAAQPPLAGHVHFLGRRAAMDAFYPELTAMLHLARQEPLGRVLLEAAAAGVPLVATAVGGTGEILGTPPAGRLVPVDSPAAASRELARLLDSPGLRRQCACAARDRIEQRFSVERAAAELVDHYRQLREPRHLP